MDWSASGKVWWEELGRTTLGSSGNSISVTLSSSRKYLKIIQYTLGATGSATGELMRFNSDSGNNYDHRRSIANAASTLTQGDNKIDVYGDVNAQSYGVYEVVNIASVNKTIFGRRMVAYPNGGSGVTWVEIAAVWRNASNQISSIQYNSTGANFQTGSFVVVLGHD